MRATRIVLGLLLFPALAAVGVVVMLAGSSGAPSAAAEPQAAQAGICTSGGPLSYTGTNGVTTPLTAAQSSVLRTIVEVGTRLNVPQPGLVIGVATALQESTLRNLANSSVPASLAYPNDGVGSDHDSVGPFQQQLGMGWGTVDQLMHTDYQATQFFTRLLKVPNWQARPATDVAQSVQISSFGDAYQKWVNSADQLVGGVLGIACGSDTVGSSGRATVVAAAMKWVGTPYAWAGGNAQGPTTGTCASGPASDDCSIVGFDCSGLTLYAYGQAGLVLPHQASAQYNSGTHIDRSALQPGDLLFLATNLNDPSTIHHVAIWIGNDAIVQAPESGENVDVVEHPFNSASFSREYIGATRPSLPGA